MNYCYLSKDLINIVFLCVDTFFEPQLFLQALLILAGSQLQGKPWACVPKPSPSVWARWKGTVCDNGWLGKCKGSGSKVVSSVALGGKQDVIAI